MSVRISKALTVLIASLLAVVIALVNAPAASSNPSVPGSSSGDGGLLWIPNYGANSVLALDARTMTLRHELKNTGDHPMVAKMSPDGSKLFVGNFGPFDWTVTVIDTKTAKIIKRLPTLFQPYATITMSANGKHLYIPTAASVVHVYDTNTLKHIRTLPIILPPGIAHIEVDPAERYVYAYTGSGFATRYDAKTGAVVGPPLFINGFFPGWGALSADGKTQYALNFFSGVTMIDSDSWSVTKTILVHPLNANPLSATLTPDGTELWVCNYSTNDIRILDAKTGVEKRRMSTPGAAVYVGFSGDGKTGYVSVVDDGRPIPMWLPNVAGGQHYEKHQAWFAKWLGLHSQIMKFDTKTFKTEGIFRTKGAMVAGVYPN